MSRNASSSAIVFFISRKSVEPDTEWAKRAAGVVCSMGYSTLSQEDFPVGGDWGEWMRSGSACPYTIAILSNKYIGSESCQKEWYAARVMKRLIPFRIEEMDPPEGETRVLYVDVFGMTEEDVCKKMEQTIARRVEQDERDNRSLWARWRVWLWSGAIALLVAVCAWLALNDSTTNRDAPPASYAFAAGQALAMLGLEPSASPETLFETSLQHLGFPEAQREALAKQFAALDQQALSDQDATRAEPARTALEAKVLGQFQVMLGPGLAACAELGMKNARLLLVLKHWSSYPPEAAAAEADRLYNQMRRLAPEVKLPKGIATSLFTSPPPMWHDANMRADVAAQLRSLQKRFDIDPLHHADARE